MVTFQEIADQFAQNMAAQHDAMYQRAYGRQQQPQYIYFSNIDDPDSWDVNEEPDIDTLGTIEQFNLRRAKEVEEENKVAVRRRREELFYDRRKEALKAFKQWNGAMTNGVNVKPICALCDKHVDYLTCRAESLARPGLFDYQIFYRFVYSAHCHGETQRVYLYPNDYVYDPSNVLAFVANWQGFALTTAFNFKGSR